MGRGAEMAKSWSGAIREVARRPLRVFPFDPMIDRFREPVVARVPYEQLRPGPVGRLVEVVIDGNGPDGQPCEPLDLDAPDVLIGEGLTPSESDPRFRQQMVYAVAMTVLEAFERGLGRVIVWNGGRRLKLMPYGMREANVYFNMAEFAVYFGYFRAQVEGHGANLPGQTVYTCLSYGVTAHEMTHPVLIELRPGDFGGEGAHEEPDVYAFHEGFADLVAVLLQCIQRDVVARTIREIGPRLVGETTLLSVAQQFGEAIGSAGPIRQFPDSPDPVRYREEMEPHARGGLLASALIEGFLASFREATADLVHLHGPLPADGWVHPDLVQRVADEVSRLSREMLDACIAAVDFLPPRALRFGDFLRGFLTADAVLFGRSHARLRAHVIDGFHSRGLVNPDVGSLAEDALRWPVASVPATVRIPHTTDALLLSIRALEWRRQCMVDLERAEKIESELQRDLQAREELWKPRIARFVMKRATELGIDAWRSGRGRQRARPGRGPARAGGVPARARPRCAAGDDADLRHRRRDPARHSGNPGTGDEVTGPW
jgi:hypothetical protein